MSQSPLFAPCRLVYTMIMGCPVASYCAGMVSVDGGGVACNDVDHVFPKEVGVYFSGPSGLVKETK